MLEKQQQQTNKRKQDKEHWKKTNEGKQMKAEDSIPWP